MKNILIISSKKYTKLKNYTDFVSLIKSKKLEFHILFVEDVEQYDNYLNKDTLVVSFGGDGTALKAMKISSQKMYGIKKIKTTTDAKKVVPQFLFIVNHQPLN